jgi:5'-nucleotidase
LIIGTPGDEKEREKARKRAEIVLNIYEKMGYDALNIGDNDLVLGAEYLRNIQKKSKIYFLSTNLKEKKTGKSLFETYFVKEMNGLKIGIIGLLTSDVPPYIHKEMTPYFIEDPIKTTIDIMNGPIANCDHIIILAHLDPPEIEALAKRVPQISIIIGGNDRSFIFPRKIHYSIWVQTDAFGLRVGRLNLNLVKGSKEFVDILPRSLIEKNIEEIQKKMEGLQYAKEVKNLMEVQDSLLEQKKKMPDTEGKNTYENYLILLHPGMKSDPEIEKMISSSGEQLKRPLP